MIPQSASGARGSSSPLGGRKPAAGCGRPLPASEARRLHNFVRERLAAAAPPPAGRGPAPLLERSSGGGGGRVGCRTLRAALPPPLRERAGGRAPRGPLSRKGGGGRAGPIRGPAPLQRSRPPSRPRPAAAGPATLFRELSPGAARPRRPPPAGLRERGAPGHLTARPVKQRPPCRGGRPDARRARSARPRGSRSREPEWMPGANTIPFIQIM